MVTLLYPSQVFWMLSAEEKYLQNVTWSVDTGKFQSDSHDQINTKMHSAQTWPVCEFLRLPFGLKTAPNTVFRRILDSVFADYLHKWLVVYVDDIIYWAMTDKVALEQYSLLFQ